MIQKILCHSELCLRQIVQIMFVEVAVLDWDPIDGSLGGIYNGNYPLVHVKIWKTCHEGCTEAASFWLNHPRWKCWWAPQILRTLHTRFFFRVPQIYLLFSFMSSRPSCWITVDTSITCNRCTCWSRHFGCPYLTCRAVITAFNAMSRNTRETFRHAKSLVASGTVTQYISAHYIVPRHIRSRPHWAKQYWVVRQAFDVINFERWHQSDREMLSLRYRTIQPNLYRRSARELAMLVRYLVMSLYL